MQVVLPPVYIVTSIIYTDYDNAIAPFHDKDNNQGIYDF